MLGSTDLFSSSVGHGLINLPLADAWNQRYPAILRDVPPSLRDAAIPHHCVATSAAHRARLTHKAECPDAAFARQTIQGLSRDYRHIQAVLPAADTDHLTSRSIPPAGRQTRRNLARAPILLSKNRPTRRFSKTAAKLVRLRESWVEAGRFKCAQQTAALRN